MKSCISFIKGMSLGVIVGVSAAAMFKYACQNNRKLRCKTTKATKAVSDIIEDIGNLIN